MKCMSLALEIMVVNELRRNGSKCCYSHLSCCRFLSELLKH